ncbi:MAG: DUF559 domain-containing protein [Candidatus Shapirobacteria bacterium]|nr:DUF559 domain-containing protein [Candidatus Shapirobacteria bacterium]MDD4410193.1 DUF559 domain-containing protein [Candidatus Shapirobacteria bacterium]
MRNIAPYEARTQIGNFKYLEDLRNLSRDNRKNPTISEKIFWELLSYKKLKLKFLRQKPIGRFILDFYCSKLLLCIEIDGDSHNKKQFQDKNRDLYLEQRKIKTVRFKNEEIVNEIEKVKENLSKIISERKQELKF